jgi:hypothetical protein
MFGGSETGAKEKKIMRNIFQNERNKKNPINSTSRRNLLNILVG